MSGILFNDPRISVKYQYFKPFDCVQKNELWLLKNIIYKLFVYKSYIFNMEENNGL